MHPHKSDKEDLNITQRVSPYRTPNLVCTCTHPQSMHLGLNRVGHKLRLLFSDVVANCLSQNAITLE